MAISTHLDEMRIIKCRENRTDNASTYTKTPPEFIYFRYLIDFYANQIQNESLNRK